MFLRLARLARLDQLALAVVVVTLAAPTLRAQDAERDVLAVVNRMFEGMRTADSGMVRSTMAAGIRFVSVNARNQPAAIEFETVDGWLQGIAKSNRRWDEQIYDVQVRVDDNMAQVWAPYTFYLDRKLSHCGVDAVDLSKDASGWKITQLADTRRRENCRDVLK